MFAKWFLSLLSASAHLFCVCIFLEERWRHWECLIATLGFPQPGIAPSMLLLVFTYLGCCITTLPGSIHLLKTHTTQAKKSWRDQYFTWAAWCDTPASVFGPGKGHQSHQCPAGVLAVTGMSQLKTDHLGSPGVHFSYLNIITIFLGTSQLYMRCSPLWLRL